MANEIVPNEIFVGDVGTVYHLPTYDADLVKTNFDPTTAGVKKLTFKMPGTAQLITRNATAAQRTIDGIAVWGLQYTVLAADVAPWSSASAGGFHQAPGKIKIQGYIEFSSSQKWSSSIVTDDQEERELEVKAVLA